jgi:hypothetical protein
MCGEGLSSPQHQSLDKETDGRCDTCDGLSGQPTSLLKISYFTANLQYTIFYNIILGLGKTKNSQDRFLAIQIGYDSTWLCSHTELSLNMKKYFAINRIIYKMVDTKYKVRQKGHAKFSHFTYIENYNETFTEKKTFFDHCDLYLL